MPKLWKETIDAHRRSVRDATLDAAADVVASRGLTAVTMSEIAERAGIGRATLYKYFPDVPSILAAWHERQVNDHLARLAQARAHGGGTVGRLHAVVRTYALIQLERGGAHGREPHGAALVAVLHGDRKLVDAHGQLHDMIEQLITDAAAQGHVRGDVAAGELAGYCLHALAAAGTLRSKAAALRLADVVLDGLRPARRGTRVPPT